MKKFRTLLALSSTALLLAACAPTTPANNEDAMEGDSASSAMMDDSMSASSVMMDDTMMQSSEAMMEDSM